MARTTKRKTEANRAAIYARVSDKSQDGEDKTSISEQTGDMEAYCESKWLTITARYQEVGRGWSKKRPEFQRMLQTPSVDASIPSCAGSPTASAGACTPPRHSWRSSRPTRFGSKPSWTPST